MAIYTRPNRRAYTMTVGGPDLLDQRDWEAATVLVDNNSTTQHLYLLDANRYVPPLTFGAVIPLPFVTTSRAKFAAPPGTTDPAPIQGESATLIFFQDVIDPHPGYSQIINIANTPAVNVNGTPNVNIANTPAVSISSGSVAISSGSVNVQNVPATSLQTAQNQKLLGTFAVAQNTGLGVTSTFALDAGAHAVSVAIAETVAGTSLNLFRIVGHQTGVVYYSQSNGSGGLKPFAIVGVMPVADTSIDVTVGRNDNNAGNDTVYVSEVFDTLASYVLNPGDASLNVLTQSPVTIAGALSALPREAVFGNLPNGALISLPFNNSGLGAGGTLALVAGVANQVIYVVQWNISADTAGNAALWLEDDTTHSGIAVFNTSVTGKLSKRLWGAGTSTGNGLRFHNRDVAATGNYSGEILYIQG